MSRVDPDRAWPIGEGEMAVRVRAHDWAATPLGRVERWPARLKHAVELVLAMPYPAVVSWGPDLLQVYNDHNIASYGHRHPAALGRPYLENFAESADAIVAARDRLFATGEAFSYDDLPWTLPGAAGEPVTRRFTGGWAPIKDDGGRVLGFIASGVDTTERATARNALHQNEERYRAFVTASSDTVYRMSPDWREMRRLDGQGVLADTTEPSEGWRERYIHPDDLPMVEAAIARAIATKSMFELEHRVRHADGSLGTVLSRAVPTLDANGEIAEWLGTGRDVTDRKRAQAALREAEGRHRDDLARQVAERTAELAQSRDLLRATMDASTDMIQVFRAVRDEAGRIVDFRWLLNNHTSESLYGEVRGESLLERNPGVVPEGVFADFARVVETGESIQIERHYAHEQFDGWFLQSVVKLDDGVATTTKDITDWKGAQADMAQLRDDAAQARIREGEDRFRGLVEGFAQAVWETDPDGRVVAQSPSWLALTGRQAGQSTASGWLDAVHADDRETVERRWREALATGQVIDIEYRLRDPADGRRWTNARAVPLVDGKGRITKWVGININVSDRREAEELLRQSEERFRQFAQCSSDVIWIRDAGTMQFEYVSPAIEHIYGMSPEEFSARHNDLSAWAEILHPEDRHRALDAFRRVRAGERVTHEFRIQRPDAGERWIRNTDFPLLDASGRVQRIAGIGDDVTDLKRAQAAIAESETRLRTLTEGIPQLVWRSCDRGRWTWASPQWLDFTGQTQEQTHGWGWLDVIHPEDRFATLKAWKAARPHGMLDVEYRVLRARDRAWVWHHTRSVPVRDADGRIVEWLGTSTDIQGLRELQERQGVLVGELQHRTRNLIGVVRSMADKSLRASADLPDFRDRFGHRMQALSRVQGLLSRLSEGERVTFDALLGAELAAMDANGDDRVTLDGPAGVALRSGTVQTLALAIHELATNAMKYGALGQTGGRLRVAWLLLPPNGHPQPRLRIDWRETGVAMPPPGSPPQGTGQGRELIERALPYQLDAETTYVFAEDGVDCSIIIPVSAHVSPEDPAHA